MNLTVSSTLNLKGATVSGLGFNQISGLKGGLDGKANLVNPHLTGIPTAPTAGPTVSNTQLATTAFVQNAVTNITGAAPVALNTLTELAAALGGDADFKTTVTGQLNLKAPKESPTFTGTVSGITKAMVGLGNVDNTTDAGKPVSTATQSALDLKANLASPTFTGTVTGITQAMVGLSAVDNTTDAGKPVSTATQSALDLKANLASPTFTGTVTGITQAMVGLSAVDNTTDAGKPVSTATQTALDAKVTNLASTQFAGNAATVTNGVDTITNQTIDGIKTFSSTIVGDITGNAATVTNGVDTITNQTIGGIKTFSNTIGGSISGNAATATKLETAITIAGSTFDGTTNITIASTDLTDGSYLATKTYVADAVASLVNGAPDALNTLGELATAIGDGASGINDLLDLKANLANPTFTGVPTAPTAANGTSSTQIATTEFVQNIVAVENVTIGYLAGNASQKSAAIAIGTSAGQIQQSTQAVAIGYHAGQNTQGTAAVAIGYQAGQNTQGVAAVAIGNYAGQVGQRVFGIAIGDSAGADNQLTNAISIGTAAGQYNQGPRAVAIGNSTGNNVQSGDAVAIGAYAGNDNQSNYAVAIGAHAGSYLQGTNAIAIGAYAGYNGQHANSIVINASGVAVNSVTAGAFHVAPIRSGTGYNLLYDPDTKEITASSAKTFVIDHPTNDNKYLVHVCLEGPESGVYYRGEGEIVNNLHTTIHLPAYVERLATEFTIQITQIYSGKKMEPLYTSRVENNSFVVYGENCEFYWHVTGKRGDVEVEPSKDKNILKGSGPYKWLE